MLRALVFAHVTHRLPSRALLSQPPVQLVKSMRVIFWFMYREPPMINATIRALYTGRIDTFLLSTLLGRGAGAVCAIFEVICDRIQRKCVTSYRLTKRKGPVQLQVHMGQMGATVVRCCR